MKIRGINQILFYIKGVHRQLFLYNIYSNIKSCHLSHPLFFINYDDNLFIDDDNEIYDRGHTEGEGLGRCK